MRYLKTFKRFINESNSDADMDVNIFKEIDNADVELIFEEISEYYEIELSRGSFIKYHEAWNKKSQNLKFVEEIFPGLESVIYQLGFANKNPILSGYSIYEDDTKIDLNSKFKEKLKELIRELNGSNGKVKNVRVLFENDIEVNHINPTELKEVSLSLSDVEFYDKGIINTSDIDNDDIEADGFYILLEFRLNEPISKELFLEYYDIRNYEKLEDSGEIYCLVDKENLLRYTTSGSWDILFDEDYFDNWYSDYEMDTCITYDLNIENTEKLINRLLQNNLSEVKEYLDTDSIDIEEIKSDLKDELIDFCNEYKYDINIIEDIYQLGSDLAYSDLIDSAYKEVYDYYVRKMRDIGNVNIIGEEDGNFKVLFDDTFIDDYLYAYENFDDDFRGSELESVFIETISNNQPNIGNYGSIDSYGSVPKEEFNTSVSKLF